MTRVLVMISLVCVTSAAVGQSETEQRQACMGDAFKFCSGSIPDRQKVAACLAANRQVVSPRCREMLDGTQTGRSPRRG